MSPEAITAERVYQRLKGDLQLGRFGPGVAINVHSLAAELDLSISPVRDALNRLVGEGAVAMRTGGGFQIPLIDEQGVSHLYAWHESLLLWTLRSAPTGAGFERLTVLVEASDEADGVGFADITADLFAWIGRQSGNIEHAAAVLQAAERLRALRILETFLPERKSELRSIVASIRVGNTTDLHRAISAYHSRRIAHAQRLIELRHTPRKQFRV